MKWNFSRRIARLARLFRHPSAPRPVRRPRFRPVLEALEDRLTPSTLPVTSTADDANQPGTLRYDVAHAQGGDTILLTGAVKSGIVLTQGELLLNQHVAIRSAGNHHITISGDGLSRVFEVTPGAQVSLSNLVLTGGDGVASPTSSHPHDGQGGAILVDSGGTLTINSSTLSGNSAAFAGGAIENCCGTVNVNDSALSGNFAPITGGAIDASGTVNVNDSALSDNSARIGGAIATGGTLFVNNSTLSGNFGVGFRNAGGAIFTFFGTVTVSNSILSDNSASSGGAIANDVGTVTVSNSTFSGNSAGDGGAIFNAKNSTVTVTGSSLVNNTAFSDGGAIFNNAATVNVGTSTFSSNSPDNIAGGFNDLGGNTVLP
jgi:hypothetical protein